MQAGPAAEICLVAFLELLICLHALQVAIPVRRSEPSPAAAGISAISPRRAQTSRSTRFEGSLIYHGVLRIGPRLSVTKTLEHPVAQPRGFPAFRVIAFAVAKIGFL